MPIKPDRQAVARRWLMVIAVAGLILIGIFAIWLIIDTGSRIVMRPRPSAAQRQSAAAMKIPLATIRPLVRLTPSDSPPIPLATIRPLVKLKSFPIEPATVRPPVSLSTFPIDPATIGSPRPAAAGIELATVSRPTLTRLPDMASLDGIIDEVKPPPRLEMDRRQAETNRDGSNHGIRIVTGFECSTPLAIEKVSDTHFKVKITTEGFRNWFMFRVEGVPEGGAVIRIDIEDAPLVKWWSLNPVYSYVTDLSDPAAFATDPVDDPRDPAPAHNGPLLPDTRGQKWHYIADVWSEHDGRRRSDGPLHMVQHFEADAFVAMRVPYTPSLNNRIMAELAGRPGVEVMQVGRSKKGRPLQVVRIGTGNPKQTPCVLIYAREHASEHDSSWAALGAIDFLLSGTAGATALLDQYTFLVIPMLDPDGAVANQYESGVISGFDDGRETVETIAWAEWMRDWVDDGNRLDLTFNLHNVESSEGPHLFAYRYEGGRRAGMCHALHQSILSHVKDFDVRREPVRAGTFSTRLGGWLRGYFGTHMMFYELNSQARGHHLSLYELKALGAGMLKGAAAHMDSPEGVVLLEDVDHLQRARRARWERYGWLPRLWNDRSVFDAELVCMGMPSIEEHHNRRERPSAWIMPLFERYGYGGPPPALRTTGDY